MTLNKVTKETLQKLLDKDGGPVVSIYIPTHRHPTPPFMQEDQTRLKNNLRLAAEQWAEAGNDASVIEPAIEELEALIDDLEFWQHTTEGLAVFIDGSNYQILHLPIECEERVVVAEGYDLTPLLVVMCLNQPYYLLALAMHDSKVYLADLYDMQELNLSMPHSPESALNIDETHANSKTVRSHQGGGASSPHGEGDSDEVGRDERTKYFRIIEDGITGWSDYDASLPILLAGTDSEVGDFRSGTRLQNLLQNCYIQGNHTETAPQELHRLARPMIHQECIEPHWQKLVDQLGDMSGTGKSSTDLDDILEAAQQGRVETLLIPVIEMSRDSVSDAVSEPVPLLRRPDEAIIDKIVKLSRLVASQGGEVCGLEKEQYLAEETQVAAIYRY